MPRFPRAAAADGVGLETGTIVPYGAGVAPDGYLLCNGSAISRTTYSALFGVIGTSYGVGDGSTTFNVPDMQGKVPVGKGASGVADIGDTGGEQEHTLIIAEMPAHTHSFNWDADPGNNNLFQCGWSVDGARTSSSTGGDGPHENMQPYVGTEYIIKT